MEFMPRGSMIGSAGWVCCVGEISWGSAGGVHHSRLGRLDSAQGGAGLAVRCYRVGIAVRANGESPRPPGRPEVVGLVSTLV